MIKQKIQSQEFLDRRKNIVANGVSAFNTANVKDAKGTIITEVDGNELIDFARGIGVVNSGHYSPPVVEASREEASKYLHTSFNVVTYEPYIKLCEELAEILPHGGKTKVMLISKVQKQLKMLSKSLGKPLKDLRSFVLAKLIMVVRLWQ